MDVGDEVLVHSSFQDTWVTGFEIGAVVDGGYRLRRRSDGRLLPSPTSPADLRVRSATGPQWSRRRTRRQI